MGTSPTLWKQYAARAGKPVNSDSVQGKRFAALSRFRARYRVAASAQSIQFNGLAAGTSDAYFASLRITLAYTALEALETALNTNDRIEILNHDLSIAFRCDSYVRMRETLLDSLSDNRGKRLRTQLSAFYSGELDDMRPLIYALRNLMCHGTLTAERLGLITSKKRRDLLHQLADEVLRAVDQRFAHFVNAGEI
jgi:hypothetical protein